MKVICIDAGTGTQSKFLQPYLTEGKEYEVVRANDKTVTVIGDDGKHRGCWPDRFVPSDGAVVAYSEQVE